MSEKNGQGVVPTGGIGADTHPGLLKLMEESGEVIREGTKLLTFPDVPYPDGSDVRQALLSECADLRAALSYFIEQNTTDQEYMDIIGRWQRKLQRFNTWHAEEKG